MESTGYEGVIAAVMAILGIVIVVGLIVSIIMIIARWKIFTKAGEEGWKAIIPIYNNMSRNRTSSKYTRKNIFFIFWSTI